MLFSSPKILLLLKRHRLEIYSTDSDQVMVVKFPQEVLRHLEIVNIDEFSKTVITALKEINIPKQQAMIALSEHVIFDKEVSLDSPAQAEPAVDEIGQFYKNIPFDEDKIAKKIMAMGDKQLLLAANRDVYQSIIQLVKEFDWTVKAVLPMTVFPKTDDQRELSPDEVQEILSSYNKYPDADFLKEDQIDPMVVPAEMADVNPKEEVVSGRTNGWFVVLLALICLSLILSTLFYFQIIALPDEVSKLLPFTSKSTPIQPTTAPITDSTVSAQPEAVESSASAEKTKEGTVSAEIKKQTKIHVLNGSDVAGQASKIKQKLTAIGYTNIITGNIQSSEASNSAIIYSTGISESIKNEIGELMDSLIGESTKGEEELNEFNIIITLGKEAQSVQ